jgi:hypothetical protein
MKSLRQTIQRSWIPEMAIIRRDMARVLGLSQPLSLNELTNFFDKPEILVFKQPSDTDALHGEVELILRSDGSYTFRGHMRATGLPSFAYKIQVFVRSAGVTIALETDGRVFGSDTPGDRERSWNEEGSYVDVSKYWAALRTNPQFEVSLEKNISGVLGGVVDVAKTVVEVFVAAHLAGVVGALIVLGANLGSATGVTIRNPNILAGVTVGAGILIVFGPSAIIPAIAAGVTSAALADIRFRSLNDKEIQLADKVFKGTLPLDRIVLTDLYNPDHKDGTNEPLAREFCYPSIDGSIQVNMGKNFDNTLGPDVNGRSVYSAPGSVFIHELTHAWQIQHTKFLPGLLCDALTNRDYIQDVKNSDNSASWSGSFSLEQQGSIVDSWYSDYFDPTSPTQELNSNEALSDRRFKYISENIRRGQA